MKKIIFIIIFVGISSSLINFSYAQSLYVDSNVAHMEPIEESKYMATSLTLTRNSNGELLSVARTDAARYLDDPIVDRFLNSETEYLVKEGNIGKNKVKMYQIEVEFIVPDCLEKTHQVPGYSDECDWYHRAFVTMLGINDENGEHWNIFRGLNHMFSVSTTDQVTSFWTILAKE